MIKADIINRVAEDAKITKVKAVEAVEAVFGAMKAAMQKGERIELRGFGVFQVKPGSLFPALHRMEQEGWIVGEWGTSENNRRARYYRLTPAGESRLDEERESWSHLVLAIEKVLQTS